MKSSNSHFFSGHSKAEWIKKIKSDLKGKKRETLQSEWLAELGLSPFVHSEDLSEYAAPLPRQWDRPHLAEAFSGHESASALIESLQHGISAPIITEWADRAAFWSDRAQVDWSMLYPIFPAENLPESWDDPNHPHQQMHFFFLSGDNAQSRSYRRQTGRFSFHIKATEANDIPMALTNWLSSMVLQIDELEANQVPQFFENSIHKKTLGRNFYLELSCLRAMRRLAHQLQSDYGVEPKPLAIWAHIGPDLALDEMKANLIPYTAAAFAAVTGGADFIQFEAARVEDPKLGRRLHRNIYHIFDMESHLFHVQDPAAGSYAIEKITQTLSQKAWEGFIKNGSE